MYETKFSVPSTLQASGSSMGATLGNTPQAIPRLEQLSSELMRLRDVAMSVASRTRTVTEHLLGTQPEKVSPNSAEPPPACKVRELEMLAQGIGEYLSAAQMQLDRLESL